MDINTEMDLLISQVVKEPTIQGSVILLVKNVAAMILQKAPNQVDLTNFANKLSISADSIAAACRARKS